jgi:hypothetical protein
MKKTIILFIFSVIFSLSTNAQSSNKIAQIKFVEDYTKDAIAHVLPIWLEENGIELGKNAVAGVYEQILDLEIEFIDTEHPRFHNVTISDGKIYITTNINYAPSYINEYFILKLLDRISDDLSLEGSN